MITQGASGKERLGFAFTLVLHRFLLLFLHCLALQQPDSGDSWCT